MITKSGWSKLSRASSRLGFPLSSPHQLYLSGKTTSSMVLLRNFLSIVFFSSADNKYYVTTNVITGLEYCLKTNIFYQTSFQVFTRFNFLDYVLVNTLKTFWNIWKQKMRKHLKVHKDEIFFGFETFLKHLKTENSKTLKGTQEWEFFWLRFWILYYFNVSYA